MRLVSVFFFINISICTFFVSCSTQENFLHRRHIDRILQDNTTIAANASSQNYAPIRIQYDTRLIESRWGENEFINQEIKIILNEILPNASKVLAQYLYVWRAINESNRIVVGELDCNIGNPINNITFQDVSFSNADLVIIVGGDLERICSTRQLAYARACTLDRQTDRPIVGKMEFCLDGSKNRTFQPMIYDIPIAPFYENFTGVLFRQDHLQISLQEIALHEMVHILGFSSNLFPYFREKNGEPRMTRDSDGEPIAITRICGDGTQTDMDNVPSENMVKVVATEDGTYQQYIVTPTVQAMARNHFNCDAIQGGRLADSSDCISSHWHERHYFGDLMGPKASKSSENTLSLLTLALLADSGWYQVDFRNVQHPAFGIGAGCNFISQPCVDNVTDRVPEWVANEFCDIPYVRLEARGAANTPDLLNHHIYFVIQATDLGRCVTLSNTRMGQHRGRVISPHQT
jgi:Leishmanolysin